MPEFRIEGMWRYPVKSMGGERLQESHAGAAGLTGDRRYVVFDVETATVASAKHPRRWAALLQCTARCLEPPLEDGPAGAVEVTLPDGAVLHSDDPDVDARLSAALGREVRLLSSLPVAPARDTDRSPVERAGTGDVVQREPLAYLAPAGTFFDLAPLHLVGAATLAALARALPEASIGPARFRPNILVGGEGLDEHAWVGRQVRLSSGGELAIIDPSPRCVMTTLAQPGLPAAPEVLRAVVAARSATSVTAMPGVTFPGILGVYARPVAPFRLRVGDGVDDGVGP